MTTSRYQVDVLVQGFPGRAVCHGGLGWSTIALLRGGGRTMLVDVGAFGIRRELGRKLAERNVTPESVTDVLLTHAHYDHAVNFPLFPNATIWIGAAELAWAANEPPGFNPLPELYVRELATSKRVRQLAGGEEFLPGWRAINGFGHTPGHMLYYLAAAEVPILFTGDSAKNRTELVSRDVELTSDRAATDRTFELIWKIWREVPGTLVIPGHDLTMRLGADGKPEYLGCREAGIYAWFGEEIRQMTLFDFAPAGWKA